MLDSEKLFFFLVLIVSAIVHEYCHGWAAERLGDPTARLAGRLTLNPLPHIDPLGTVLLPVLLMALPENSLFFAYAKPVPVNPANLRRPKRDAGLVAFAGPGINLVFALVLGLLVRNLPVGPFAYYLAIAVYVNLMLAVFNLMPFPPLDGSKILFAALPDRWHTVEVFLQTYGLWLFLPAVFFIFPWLSPLLHWLFTLVTGQPG